MASQIFHCVDCNYEEYRLAPNYITVSSSPCPKCGGKMVRNS